MASTISHAWCASRTISRANCEAASAASLRSARRWLRALMPARRGTIAASTGSRVGSAIVDTTKAVQMIAACRGSSHPASNATALAGGDDVRRRLSNIFHRPLSGSVPRPPMLARGSYVVSRRKLLNDLDVGDQTGARKYPFEEVVAEQRVLGYTAR